MAREGLGRLFDISAGFTPVNLATAANTGKRVYLKDAAACTVVIYKGAGTAGDDPTITLKQHTASTAGTTADLAIIDHYYKKSETTLDGDETWVKETQTAAATIVDPGGDGTSAEEEQIIVIEVDAAQLSDGYKYISVDVGDVGTNAQLGCALYILHDLLVKRAPANLAAPLR